MNRTAVVFLIASFGVAIIFVFLLTMGSTGKNNDDGVISGTSNISDTSDGKSDTQDTPVIAEDVEELSIETLIEGEGDGAENGDTLVVHYRGTLLDGTPFDNSYDRGQPFDLILGAGSVIQGWEEGLQGVKAGETRKIIIPSNMGYGEYGSPPTIPGGAALVFEVEVVEIK